MLRSSALALLLAAYVAWQHKSGHLHLTLLNNLLVARQSGSVRLQAALERRQPPLSKVPLAEFKGNTLDAATFSQLSSHHTVPLVVRGAFADAPALERWNTSYLAARFPEASLALERRIDPTLSDGSYADRLRAYERGEVHQVNQVFYNVLHAEQIDRVVADLGRERVAAAFELSGYAPGGLLAGGLFAITVNVYRTAASRPSGVAWHAHLVECPTTVQVRGPKRWRMAPPIATPLLRPDPQWEGAVLFGGHDARYSYATSESRTRTLPDPARAAC